MVFVAKSRKLVFPLFTLFMFGTYAVHVFDFQRAHALTWRLHLMKVKL
jgi:hypothetical protein